MNKIKVLLALLLVFILFLCGCQKTIHEHVYDKSIVVFEPTCSKLGKVIKQCECGEVIVDSLDTVAHSFQNGECIYCHVSSVYLCEHKVVGGETVPSTCSQKGSIGKGM